MVAISFLPTLIASFGNKMMRKVARQLCCDSRPATSTVSGMEWLQEPLLRVEHLPILHYKVDILQQLDIPQWIAVDRDHVRECAWRNDAYLSFHVEHDRSARGCALDGVHRLHSQFHHAREVLGDRLRPRNAAHVGPIDYLHAGFQGLLE